MTFSFANAVLKHEICREILFTAFMLQLMPISVVMIMVTMIIATTTITLITTAVTINGSFEHTPPQQSGRSWHQRVVALFRRVSVIRRR